MKRLTSATLALALIALVTACSGDGADPTPTTGAGGEEVTITIANFDFSGPETASVGDTVTVTNEDAVAHTWTAVDGEFDSGSVAQNESFEFSFDEAGEFDFFCSFHPQMTGTITVEG